MKSNRLYFILLFCIFISGSVFPTELSGQERKSFININVGGGTGQLTDKITGKVKTTYSDGTQETNTIGYDLHYEIIPHAFVDVEYILDGFVVMFEGKYGKAKYSDYDEYTNKDFLDLDPTSFDDANMYSASFYFGVNLFHGKRFQMPLLVGAGLTHIGAEPVKSLYLDFGYKARAKFYFTNSIGIFAGVAGSYGTSYSDKFHNLAPSSDSYELTSRPFYAEAGLTVMIGRKK